MRQPLTRLVIVLVLTVIVCVAWHGDAMPPGKSFHPITPDVVAGCYELTMSKWSPDINMGEDAEFITPPPRIQLTAEHGKTRRDSEGYLVLPAPGTPPSIHRFAYWEPASSKSIRIVWTNGMSGLSMKLRIQGDMLQGEARTFWDFMRRGQTAKVTASRTDCSPR